MTRPPVARAAIMTAPGSELQLRELPLMRPPLGGAVVKVLCCTICKSDLHTWLGRRAGPTPAILGHEAVGSIVELGEGLVCDAAGRTIAVGDRVTWTMHDCCGQCRYCAQYGLPMKCQALRKYGHQSCEEPPYLFGGFAEYSVITPGMRLLKLPDSLPELIAAPANCAVATVAAGWRAVSLQAGANVLIQGAGGLGCYAAALAAQAGCNRVIITDTSAERLLVAREFGATDGIDVSLANSDEVLGRVHELTRGYGVDYAMEAAGDPRAVEPGLRCLRRGGHYVEIGCSFPAAHAVIDLSLILWNRLTMHGIHNYDVQDLCAAVEFLNAAQRKYPFHEAIAASFPLDRINEALALAQSGGRTRVAVIP